MRIELTNDSPVLIKIIPEDQNESFNNGRLSQRLNTMGIKHICQENNGALLINIDPYWKDFGKAEK